MKDLSQLPDKIKVKDIKNLEEYGIGDEYLKNVRIDRYYNSYESVTYIDSVVLYVDFENYQNIVLYKLSYDLVILEEEFESIEIKIEKEKILSLHYILTSLPKIIVELPLYRSIYLFEPHLSEFENLMEKYFVSNDTGGAEELFSNETNFMLKNISLHRINDKKNHKFCKIVYHNKNGYNLYGGCLTFEIQCAIKSEIISRYFQFYYEADKGRITKIGQYPSSADLALPKLKKYRKLLGNEKYKELTKAAGLKAHGVGAGSFVYLRRIFEHLVIKAEGEANIDYSNANPKLRMDERVKALKGYLPDFMINNAALYGIMSKGVHELSEDTCLSYFDLIYDSIAATLDEKLEKIEKQERNKKLSCDINQLNGKLKE
jgi:hypothetical protein